MIPPVTDLLPHRGASLYLSRVVSWSDAELVAEATFDADAFPGHFPGQAVVPGVVLIESAAQALACLGRLRGETGQAVLMRVSEARFRAMVSPPCALRVHVRIVERGFGLTTARAEVYQGERRLCTTTLTAGLL